MGAEASKEGFDSFMAFAAVLADPGKVAQEYAKLKAAKDEAQAIIDQVGPVKDLLAARDVAQRDAAEAAALKTKAAADYDTLMDAVNKDAKNLIEQAQAKADAILSEAEEAKVLVSMLQADAVKALDEATKVKATAAKALDKALIQAEVDKLRQEAELMRVEAQKAKAEAEVLCQKQRDALAALDAQKAALRAALG